MSFKEARILIKIENVSKVYEIWKSPASRLLVPFYKWITERIASGRLSEMLNNRINQQLEHFTALSSINFELRRGQAIGIVGRNGAGKSTLLKIITGVLRPTTGTVVKKGRINALLELGTGFNSDLTGIENIYLNGSLIGIKKAELDEKLGDIERFAEIGNFINQPVKRYSSGMKMRLAFAVTTCLDPDVLIIDEALAVGDDAFRRKCYSRIEDLRAKGCALLFVSHAAGTVIQLCDAAILLSAGKMVQKGSPKLVIGTHQRLMNASKEEEGNIIEKIESENLDSQETFDSKQKQKTVSLEGFYDRNLTSKSKVEFEPKGAIIENIRLTDFENNKLNVLEKGKRYRLNYEVSFCENCKSVRFSMLIKTTEGFALGGMVTDQISKGIRSVKKGTRIFLDFYFRCNLTPGTYFINAGVKGLFEETEIFHHRILDALVFRVSEEDNNVITSFVDFDINCKVSTL
ncbi:ABC transporter ATP-binding protein [Candidatus Pelagisphaera phototrophica]|uniref:ABC transporter ATP-binding protein n=1 Tax=Candidatus Pelagisphaera phototrophica TaxID=2684113 RepID=UPI001A02629B|nr:ABC transporter ATP-binding protein [Candidatus Pelagisphaera phototrophica]QXD32526.1 ABC transporter ATP-binding protein [Candidatus Pelagisphaera phototrophica]